MMENRSFDHYLGWMPDADGHQAGLHYTDKDGVVHGTQRLTPDFQGCGHPDPDHSWDGGRTQFDGGACDGFLRSGDNDVFSISYYAEGDLGFIQDAAKTFTTFDRFHCSLMGSTLPNREYMWAGESYGNRDNALPPQTPHTTGFPDNTLFAALDKAGVSNRYFFNDVPVSALWGVDRLQGSGSIAEYYERCASGTLPRVSYVDPNFAGSVGEGPGLSGDEHPHGDVRAGQAFMAASCTRSWGRRSSSAARCSRMRVDPEVHLLPLRGRAAAHARAVRQQRRALVRLAPQAAARGPRTATSRARRLAAVHRQSRRRRRGPRA